MRRWYLSFSYQSRNESGIICQINQTASDRVLESPKTSIPDAALIETLRIPNATDVTFSDTPPGANVGHGLMTLATIGSTKTGSKAFTVGLNKYWSRGNRDVCLSS